MALENQWLYGTDRTLFESFASYIWRKVANDLQSIGDWLGKMFAWTSVALANQDISYRFNIINKEIDISSINQCPRGVSARFSIHLHVRELEVLKGIASYLKL